MNASQQAAWTGFTVSAIGLITTAISARIFRDQPSEHRVITRCHTALAVLLALSAVAILTSP